MRPYESDIVVTDKAYVCNSCRKVVCYKLKQAGTTLPCPFCGNPVSLPVNKDFQSDHQAGRAKYVWWCVFAGVALAGLAIGMAFVKGGSSASPARILSEFGVGTRVTVAPDPVRLRKPHIALSVKRARYGCPEIYHSALKKSLSSEKPVLWLELEVQNTGGKQIGFRSWQMFEADGEGALPTLTDRAGQACSLVHFGADTYPVGTKKQETIGPGETLVDRVYFYCPVKPRLDLQLSLPCDNVGGKGRIDCAIPCGLIQE